MRIRKLRARRFGKSPSTIIATKITTAYGKQRFKRQWWLANTSTLLNIEYQDSAKAVKEIQKDFESDNMRVQEGQNIFFNVKMEAGAGLLVQLSVNNLIKILTVVVLTLTIIFLINKIFNKNKSARKKITNKHKL